MSLVLDGTNGLSDVDGSAATPAIRGTDTNTGIFFPAADTIAFAEGGTESARFDSSGNLLVGTTLLASGFSTFAQIQASGATGGVLINSATNNIGRLIFSNNNASGNEGLIRYDGSNQSMQFWTAANERARIDSSGNFGLGATPNANWGSFYRAIEGSPTSGLYLTSANVNSSGLLSNAYASNSGWFRHTSGAASIIQVNLGRIDTYTAVSNPAGSAVAWVQGPYLSNSGTSWTNGASDIRQKKNFEPSQGLAELMQVEAVKYHFNWDGDDQPKRLGFKAQNLQTIIPEMVQEQPERFADDGSPLLTITPDYILPVLVKAIQEQQAIITALTARVEALDARLISLEGTQP